MNLGLSLGSWGFHVIFFSLKYTIRLWGNFPRDHLIQLSDAEQDDYNVRSCWPRAWLEVRTLRAIYDYASCIGHIMHPPSKSIYQSVRIPSYVHVSKLKMDREQSQALPYSCCEISLLAFDTWFLLWHNLPSVSKGHLPDIYMHLSWLRRKCHVVL